MLASRRIKSLLSHPDLGDLVMGGRRRAQPDEITAPTVQPDEITAARSPPLFAGNGRSHPRVYGERQSPTCSTCTCTQVSVTVTFNPQHSGVVHLLPNGNITSHFYSSVLLLVLIYTLRSAQIILLDPQTWSKKTFFFLKKCFSHTSRLQTFHPLFLFSTL